MRSINLKHVLFILMSLALAGCNESSKPKADTIRAMASYLDSKPKKAAVVAESCLSKELSPPTSIPSHVKFAGYILGNVTSPASTSLAGWNSTLDEVVGQGNTVVVSYLTQELLDPSINPDELIINKIVAAKARGFKIVIEIPLIFFELNIAKRRLEVSSLSPNYRSNWGHFKDLIAPHIDSIAGFYPLDEPYWNALGQGVPASDMKQFLDEIAITIKADLPQIPLVFIEAYTMINADLQIPAGYDWVGMDCYGSFDSCGQPGSQRSIPEYYNVLKSKMSANQKLVVVPEAFLFTETPTEAEQTALLQRSKKFLNWIESEPRIVAIVPFIYRNLAEEHISGAREMCPVREFYRTYLQSGIKTPGEDQATLSISCPTTIQEGGSGTCSATNTGTLASGYWTLNGAKVAQSENRSSFTWNNVPIGTYKIQGVAKDKSGNTILSNIATVTVNEKVIILGAFSISCPTTLLEGESGTCSSTNTGALVSGYWTLNGAKVAQSDNRKTFTWNNIPAGTYKIQGVGQNKNGNSIVSNIVTVTVNKKATLSISCPTTNLFEGVSGSCSSTSTGTLVSGYWIVNGAKVPQSDNRTSFAWNNIPAGTYKVQGAAKDNLGNSIVSNIVTVTVNKKAGLSISCPTTLNEGASGTCSSTTTGTLVSGYWTLNGAKVAQSDNRTSFTWNNVPAGTYKIQGVAKDNLGNSILSNIVTVTVKKKATLSISCPTTLVAGASGTCSSTSTGTLVSGYWMLNGSKVAQSDNRTSYTWSNIPAGTYTIQGAAVDNLGNSILSNVVTVTVRKR